MAAAKGIEAALKQLKLRQPQSYFIFEHKANSPCHYYETPESNDTRKLYTDFKQWCEANEDTKGFLKLYASKKKNNTFLPSEHVCFNFKVNEDEPEEVGSEVQPDKNQLAKYDNLLSELSERLTKAEAHNKILEAQINDFEEEEEEPEEEEEEEVSGVDKYTKFFDSADKFLSNPKVDSLIDKVGAIFFKHVPTSQEKKIAMNGTQKESTDMFSTNNISDKRDSTAKQKNIQDAITSLIKNDKDFDLVLIKLAQLQIDNEPKYNMAKSLL